MIRWVTFKNSDSYCAADDKYRIANAQNTIANVKICRKILQNWMFIEYDLRHCAPFEKWQNIKLQRIIIPLRQSAVVNSNCVFITTFKIIFEMRESVWFTHPPPISMRFSAQVCSNVRSKIQRFQQQIDGLEKWSWRMFQGLKSYRQLDRVQCA